MKGLRALACVAAACGMCGAMANEPAPAAEPTPAAVTAAPPASATGPAPAAASAAPPTEPAPVAPAVPVRLQVSRVATDFQGRALDNDRRILRVVRRDHMHREVAGQAALNMVMLALGGGFSVRTVGKEEFKGDPVQGVEQPAQVVNPGYTLFPELMERRVNEWLAVHPKGQAQTFSKPLVPTGLSWRLLYADGTDAPDTFRLQLEVGLFKWREAASWPMPNFRPGKHCTWTSEPRRLADWQANDYQAVAEAAPVATRHCVEHFVPQLGAMLELE